MRVQAGRELDVDAHNQITPIAGLFRNDHAQTWETFFMTGLCRTGFGDADRFAVDGTYNALPACQGFLETEFNGRDEIVTFADEVWVW